MAEENIYYCMKYLLETANALLILGCLTFLSYDIRILVDDSAYRKRATFWISEEKLATNDEEMEAKVMDAYEEDLTICGFLLLITGVLVLLIHLLQRFLFGINSILSKLLMYGSILACFIGMVMITRENALTKLYSYIIQVLNDEDEITITDIEPVVLFGGQLILVSTQIYSAIVIWMYPVKVLSLLLMLGSLILTFAGSWIVLDVKSFNDFGKMSNSESQKIRSDFSVSDEQLDELFCRALTIFGTKIVIAGMTGLVISLLEFCGKLKGYRLLTLCLLIIFAFWITGLGI